jgi:hypothetical protein
MRLRQLSMSSAQRTRIGTVPAGKISNQVLGMDLPASTVGEKMVAGTPRSSMIKVAR